MYHLIATQTRTRSKNDPQRPPVFIESDDDFEACWAHALRLSSELRTMPVVEQATLRGGVLAGNLPAFKNDNWTYWIVRQD